MLQRTKNDLHPLGADLGLHQSGPQLLAVDGAVGRADAHQLLKSGVGELSWHLGGGNCRRQG
jgi:hypothetical protein